MTQRVDICNLALAHVGAKNKIMSMDDRGPEAGHCRNMYDPALRATLAGFDWNFARVTRTLTPAGDGYLASGWSYAYVYPSDCLKLRSLVRAIRYGTPPRWTILRAPDKLKTIQTDMPNATAIYTGYDAEPSLYDDQFIVAFSFRLASLLAGPLARDKSAAKSFLDRFDMEIEKAALDSANENGDAYAYGLSDASAEPDWIRDR